MPIITDIIEDGRVTQTANEAKHTNSTREESRVPGRREMINKYQSMWAELKRRANTTGNEDGLEIGPALQRWITEIEAAETDNLLKEIFEEEY